MRLSTELQHRWINGLLFQLVWFSAMMAPLVVMVLVMVVYSWHFFCVGQQRARESVGLLLVVLAGWSMDSLLSYWQFYRFNPPEPQAMLPGYLYLLWIGFAMTLPRSLAWLIPSGWRFVLLCAVMGPLSYLAARQIGVVSFDNHVVSLICLEWLVIGMLVWWLRGCFVAQKKKGSV